MNKHIMRLCLPLICFAAEGTETSAPVVEDKNKIDLSETKYFSPDILATDGAEYASKVTALADAAKIPFFRNFTNEIPEGFGLLVQPVQKRDKSKQEDEKGSLVVTGIILSAVPDIATLLADPKGMHYLRGTLNEAMGRRLKAITVAALKENSAPQLPSTIEGFIEAIRARSPLYTYNQLQERLRKSLEKKGVKLSKEMLQGVLQSQSFAEQLLPNIAQAQWGIVLDRAIKVASQENLDPAILVNWKTSRDTASFSHVEEAAFDDLVL